MTRKPAFNRHGPVLDRVAFKQARRRDLAQVVLDLCASGPIEGMSRDRLAELMGADAVEIDLSKALTILRRLGILRSEVVYGDKVNGLGAGRHATWSAGMSQADAMAVLDELDEQERRTIAANRRAAGAKIVATRSNRAHKETAMAPDPKPVSTDQTVVRYERDQPVEAISGPDAPSPLASLAEARRDESYAIVEAARQYLGRSDRMETQIHALLGQARELGLTVDEAALRSSISPDKPDERLEAITLALPYIDRLERRISRAEETITKLRAQLTEQDRLNREVISLRRQNSQLIARQVAN